MFILFLGQWYIHIFFNQIKKYVCRELLFNKVTQGTVYTISKCICKFQGFLLEIEIETETETKRYISNFS